MSLLHYLAANKLLPTGEFGSIKIKDANNPKAIVFLKAEQLEGTTPLNQIIDMPELQEDEIVVYESSEDAAGIYIMAIDHEYRSVQKQFKNKFVYSLSPNFGIFQVDDELKRISIECYRDNKKCVDTLFNFIYSQVTPGESIELYSCWAGEEEEEKNGKLDTCIDISTFEMGRTFKLQERQYIRFKR